MNTVVWCAVFLSMGSLLYAEQEPKDEYQVVIQKTSGTSNIAYTFCQTNITGGTVVSKSEECVLYPLDTESQEVVIEKFPALKRSTKLAQRATKYTRLFVTKNTEEDKRALGALINNVATSEQKKRVASAKIPQKIGSYCTGKLIFVVSEKKGTVSIKVNDQRICMRSGSRKAQETREIAKREREQKKQGNLETEQPPAYEPGVGQGPYFQDPGGSFFEITK